MHYTHIVKYIAGRLFVNYKKTVEYDDLLSYGIFGLIDAIDKYDYTKGVKFETYANIRVRGAIIDQLRENDWIPRSIRQKAKEIENAYEEFEAKEGKSARDIEIANKLGISIDELHKRIQNISTYAVVSLDEYLDHNKEISISHTESNSIPENRILEDEFKDTLARVIDELPERENTIISLYYFEELTYKEIGAVLNISESRVSQLHTKAIIKLKNKLKAY